MPTQSLPASFTRRKALILSQLSVPADQYDDLSPKGSIDEGVRDLINAINAREGWVTTSSCAGRVSVFVEGERRRKRIGSAEGGEGRETGREEADAEDGDAELLEGGEEKAHGGLGRDVDESERLETGRVKLAGAGGKGGGGRWLFVSHEPVVMKRVRAEGVLSFLGLRKVGEEIEAGKSFTEERLVHFKFEPMILHVLTASLPHAQAILKAALQAGFRESGALNLISASNETVTPMVAVRSAGLSLDSIIGRLGADEEGISIVSDTYLEGLLTIANERFEENSIRIHRFQKLLLSSTSSMAEIEPGRIAGESAWEDASVRRERKRAEGLKRSQELKGRE